MEFVHHRDLESDEEMVEALLTSASELFAAVGEADLAIRLEDIRQAVTNEWPTWSEPQRDHDDWLRSKGVEGTADAQDGDVQAGLHLIRAWLEDSGR